MIKMNKANLLMVLISFLAAGLTSPAMAAGSSSRSACFAMFNGSYVGNIVLIQNVSYACDGAPVQILTLADKGASNESRISYGESIFIQQGYSIVSCQYAVGEGMLPQYTCTFARQ